jgi:hypothetical protein
MTVKQRQKAIAEANRWDDRAEYFRRRGDTASADKAAAAAAAIRAGLRRMG